ncbi:MAG: radical SAM protein [Lachnospiraceae bacterium]|nr:radical SAM protein [Lachnospiraceae bacterium]
MRVLLANPETSRSFYDFAGIIDDEPYELECLQAHLASKGIKSEIWDGQFDKDFRRAYLEYRPDYVYFCGRTRQENFIKEYCEFCKDLSAQNLEIEKLSEERNNEGKKRENKLTGWFRKHVTEKRIKSRYAQIPISDDPEGSSADDGPIKAAITIVGGIHAQNCPERLQEKYIDYIVSTFDPDAVSDIIKKRKAPKNIPGISYKALNPDGTIEWQTNNKAPYDIKNMPWADRTNFYKYGEKYCYLELRPIAVIRTAYSCPYTCAFCYRNRLNCHRYTVRDIEDVVREIESIDCENIYIVDDDFLVNIHRLERFIELIKERNIHKKYVCFGRADFIAKYPHVIKKLAEIGFYYILTGLEYIENRRLNDTHKRNDVNTNVRALRVCQEFGINMMGMFITDLDFTGHDFRNLYKWIRHFDIKHVAISIYTPEMCLENFAEYKDRLITDDPGEWDYLHVVARPTKLSVKKYYFHYHILLIKLFLRAQRQGVYDFMDYKAFIKSFMKNLFRFGG